jgi:thiamine kinase-like enzyme
MTNARDSVREGRSESPFFADHPAVRAWRSLDASVAPAAVETLKDTLRARIFRLSGPVSVIAKQVTSDAAFNERLITSEILPSLAIPTPRYLGEVEAGGGYTWMFFDDFSGEPFDAEKHGALAAAWIARLHSAAAKVDLEGKLPAAGVRRAFSDLCSLRPHRVVQCELLEIGWPHVEKYCQGASPTLVHGEFRASNLRVREGMIVPLDWASAGWGGAFLDLAEIDLNVYAEARGIDPEAVSRTAKMGRVFFWVRQLADGTSDFDTCRHSLTAAVLEIKWKPRSERSPSEAPSVDALIAALTKVAGQRIDILERKHNRYSSTFPSEILTVCLPDGAACRMLAKYEYDRFRNVGSHRGGPSYEADVYRHVLGSVDLPRPRLWGALEQNLDGGTWLFLEFVENAVRADEAADPAEALRRAARWAGLFHSTAKPATCLNRYDAAYYQSWAQRAAEYSSVWHTRYPWLQHFCVRAQDLIAALGAAPTAVIHGEFTPHNLLARDNEIYPVDWESAAVGVAEIDLASLTDGWPDEVVAACEREYISARFGSAAPDDFVERLELARLYWALRWIGNAPGAFPTFRLRRRVELLAPLARRIGVMS